MTDQGREAEAAGERRAGSVNPAEGWGWETGINGWEIIPGLTEQNSKLRKKSVFHSATVNWNAHYPPPKSKILIVL